mmetsp:Transcript_89303/g.193290  ORF Transcript_89303/g.193290 Transcript_89303/m.193290 type:complete len:273 (-) Transcript_89303:47-865(-)
MGPLPAAGALMPRGRGPSGRGGRRRCVGGGARGAPASPQSAQAPPTERPPAATGGAPPRASRAAPWEPFLSDFCASCAGVCPLEFCRAGSAPAARRQRMISALFSFTATCRAWVELNMLFFLAATSPKPFFLSHASAFARSAACFSSSRRRRSARAASCARRCCSSRSMRTRSAWAAASSARRLSSARRQASSSAARLASSCLRRAAWASASAAACWRAASSAASCWRLSSSSVITTGMFTFTVSVVESELEQALQLNQDDIATGWILGGVR